MLYIYICIYAKNAARKTPSLISRPNPDHWYWHIFIVMRLNYNKKKGPGQQKTLHTIHYHTPLSLLLRQHAMCPPLDSAHAYSVYNIDKQKPIQQSRICIAVKNAVSDPQNSLFIIGVDVVVAPYVCVLCVLCPALCRTLFRLGDMPSKVETSSCVCDGVCNRIRSFVRRSK